MWHWIQNGLSKKRQQFFFDILIFVTSVHLLCILCACIYQSKRGIEQISLIAPDIRTSTLVFVPLHKKIEQPAAKSSANSLQKPHHMMNYDEFLDRQKKAESVLKSGNSATGLAAGSLEKKSAEKKVVQKALAQKKPAEKKPVVQKPPTKKVPTQSIAESKKIESKKELPVQKAEKKAVAPQKSLKDTVSAATSIKTESTKTKKVDVKKPAEKVSASAQKQVEKIVEKKTAGDVEKISQEIVAPQVVEKIPSQEIPLQKIVSQEPVQQESELQPVQKEQCTHSVDQQESVLPMIDLNDVTFIGVQDLEHLELQQLVAGKLAQYWKRPVGMESKLCVIKIELHANGKILSVVVEKSSGVPMYDMAAKAAALKTIYPQEIWNKKLVIQF